MSKKTAKTTVSIMGDYCATGIWRNGSSIDITSLPKSTHYLKGKLDMWQEMYEILMHSYNNYNDKAEKYIFSNSFKASGRFRHKRRFTMFNPKTDETTKYSEKYGKSGERDFYINVTLKNFLQLGYEISIELKSILKNRYIVYYFDEFTNESFEIKANDCKTPKRIYK